MNVALLNKVARVVRRNTLKYQSVRSCSKRSEDPAIPVNTLRDKFTATGQPDNGVPSDKKPFKYRCEAGKVYSWCLCGHSKNQPFCDGTHRNVYMNIKLRPIKFSVAETKDYWLCNCKQTSNRPFCDGTHHREDIQEKFKR